MKNLLILVKMQLKEQFNFKRLSVKNADIFQILVSVLAAILKFALVTALCFAFLFVAKLLNLFSFGDMPIPSTVISFLFVTMLALSMISCIVGVTKSMYYARDNAVLLTLPCRPVQVYLSKLIIFFVFEVKRNFSFLIPLFVAYYIMNGYAIFTYFWMIFCMMWISLFCVASGALLSIPAMWIANFFRQHRSLQITSVVFIVGGTVAALFFAISLIPSNINLIQNWNNICWQYIYPFFDGYKRTCSALYDISLIILRDTTKSALSIPIGPSILRFLVIMGSSALLLVIGFLIVRPLFYKMASTPFEYLKKQVKPKPNTLRTRRISVVHHEFLISVKTPQRLFSNVGIVISIPILIFLLNKIFLAMDTAALGDYMVIAFNVLIILLVALNANCYASSIFSRDGRSSYLIKTQPSKYPILILAKLLPNTVFVLSSLTATYVILLILEIPIGVLDTTVLMLSIGMTYLAHMLYCADQDLMNPQFELYATVGSSEINKNEMKATVSAFLISFLVAGIMFFLLYESVGISVYMKFFVISLIAVLYRTYIFFSNLRVYYKEK